MLPAETTNVLVCGAGPVGLLVALGLAQQGVDTLIIEKRELETQEQYGRACTLYPRTLELLEQLGLAEDVTQAAYIGRTYSVFKHGKRITRKTFQEMSPLMDNSFHNYVVNIRQNNSQRIFASKYNDDHNRQVHYGWEIVEQKVDTSLGDGFNVTATLVHTSLGRRVVRCKYVVGADGGQSTVRRLADIAMEGTDTTYKWVRVDGRIKTDMPDPSLSFAQLESETHGTVLWVKLDRDAHRIGFALSPRLQAKYPDGMTQDQAIHEAIESVKPFKLEIERLDWWTHYSIKQKVASTLLADNYILLAGDAAHTHSSAFAQGMNTGVHDATNLIWKLAGTLKGWYKPEVLNSYASERRAAAEQLIGLDRTAAAVVSGDIPAQYKAASLKPEEIFQLIMRSNMSLTIGLGISYDTSILNRDPTATTLFPGSRGPDALLHAPGPSVPVRLHSITHRESRGRWSFLVFTGRHYLTGPKVAALRERLNTPGSRFAHWRPMLNMCTIMIGTVGSAWEAFDGPAVGKLYFDLESLAHNRYGVYDDHGAVVILRPDGIIAFAAGLDELDKIEEYFAAISS